jgi:hypothetical protein
VGHPTWLLPTVVLLCALAVMAAVVGVVVGLTIAAVGLALAAAALGIATAVRTNKHLTPAFPPRGDVDLIARRDLVAELDAELGHERAASEQFARDVRRLATSLDVPSEESPLVVLDAVAARVEEQRAYEASIDQAERALTARCGAATPTRAHALDLLRGASPADWAARLEAVTTEQGDANAERDATTRELLQLEGDIERALESADVVRRDQRLASLTADLADATREWFVVSTAHALIDATLSASNRDRQPQVVRRAGALFERVTSGRYPRLLAGDDTLFAIDATGRRIDPVALSRGTRDLLYLCLRLALAEELASTTPLPMLLDDVLVNFDEPRARAMAEVMVDFASRHQVLVFTCHRQTVEHFRIAAHFSGATPSRAGDVSMRIIELPPSGPMAGTDAKVSGSGRLG